MKNKKITIYELIGLMKNGKAPEKIKYDGEIYYYNNELCDYDSPAKGICLLELMFGGGIDWLHTEVKILPAENDEWEDIEELKRLNFGGDCKTRYYSQNSIGYEFPSEIIDVLNKLIKNQKYLKERIDKK